MIKMQYNLILLILFFTSSLTAQIHSKFTAILKVHVNNGWVDYDKLKDDYRLKDYTDALERINPDSIKNENLRLAYWINVYNAFTLKIVSENYPIESINDLHKGGLILGQVLGTTIWHHEFININGKKLSLNNVEHDIIRKQFKEPRIHFALVCAAISCPPLLNEAYEGSKLNEQLNFNSLHFFRNKEKNRFDLKTKTAYLTKIIDWYSEDFGNSDSDIIKYVGQFAPLEVKESMLNESDEWEIEYMDYDWALNDIKNKP